MIEFHELILLFFLRITRNDSWYVDVTICRDMCSFLIPANQFLDVHGEGRNY